MAKFGAILAQGIIDAGERENLIWITYCEIKASISLNFCWLAVSMNSYRHEWHVIEYIIKDTNKNSFIAV